LENQKEIYSVKPIAIEYTYYLNYEVTCTSDYQYLFEILSNATENDTVRLMIANYGGSLTTCISIVNAIRQSQASVVGVLTSIAYSAAGAIFLACDGHEVLRHTSFMGHDAIGGSYGSLAQIDREIEHKRDVLTSFCNDVYKGFLSDEEIAELVQGKSDLWLNEESIVERLDRKHKLLREDYDNYMKESSYSKEDLKKLTKKDLIEIITSNI